MGIISVINIGSSSMFQKIHQFINDHSLWSGDWQIFYAGLAVPFVLWLGQLAWKRFIRRPSKFEGDVYDLNFPSSDNKLVGRERDIQALDDALENPQTRLMVLTAGSGSGKTMLARNWLERIKANKSDTSIQRIYCWSFQNQGVDTFTSSAEVLVDVCVSRIQRDGNYITQQLGAYSDSLALLVNFFDQPWSKPVTVLTKRDQAITLSSAGLELQADAVDSGVLSVKHADQSGGDWIRIGARVYLAFAYYQKNDYRALELFQEAESLIKKSGHESLYGIWGFYYCEALLDNGKIQEVIRRANFSLEMSLESARLLDNALDKLTLGRVDHLPRALLTRAALHRDLGEYDLAEQDLAELSGIAEAGDMRLFIIDYHLERTRLLLVSGGEYDIQLT